MYPFPTNAVAFKQGSRLLLSSHFYTKRRRDKEVFVHSEQHKRTKSERGLHHFHLIQSSPCLHYVTQLSDKGVNREIKKFKNEMTGENLLDETQKVEVD